MIFMGFFFLPLILVVCRCRVRILMCMRFSFKLILSFGRHFESAQLVVADDQVGVEKKNMV